jgi:hypothetical protein
MQVTSQERSILFRVLTSYARDLAKHVAILGPARGEQYAQELLTVDGFLTKMTSATAPIEAVEAPHPIKGAVNPVQVQKSSFASAVDFLTKPL